MYCYYGLPRDKRWLPSGDSPYCIGGRATDVSQIAASLRHYIRELFPINKVPSRLVEELDSLTASLEKGERGIAAFIDVASTYADAMVNRG